MEIITIPYEDYKELLSESMMYKDINRELQFILRNCGWDIYREELNIDDDMKKFMDKYIPNDVKKREKEFANENKESEEK